MMSWCNLLNSCIISLFFWRNGKQHLLITLNCKWFSLIVSVLKLPLNYFLAGSSKMVDHTYTPSLEKKYINMVSWHNFMTTRFLKFLPFSLFLPFWGNFSFFCLPCNFISFNAKEIELCSYIKSKWSMSSWEI